MKILISDIKILDRQRLDLGDIPDLADSLSRLGQIQAIGVNERNELIWGRRRLAAATYLGWTEIECMQRIGLTYEMEQELELEEDLKRKDRTWQERCLAIEKLHRIKARMARTNNEEWNYRMLSELAKVSTGTVSYMIQCANGLSVIPRDEQLWACDNYFEALSLLRDRAGREANIELERRRQANIAATPVAGAIPNYVFGEAVVQPTSSPGLVQSLNPTPARPLSLRDRAQLYNTAYAHLWKQQLYFTSNPAALNEQFLTGFWFVGGGNISELYGSYQIEYLKRIETLFPDATRVVHLFVGSLPPSDKYTRVGLAQGDSKPDIECDAHELSSKLPFNPDLIYADPPYSVEDSEHYANAMVNREKVMSECALVLKPGGFLVWMDQALPLFSNNELRMVGCISYIRSTGNRFRCVVIFQKPL